jgi:dethiobiotin synthetase
MDCRGLMFLGTDTEVGKTYAACLALRELVRSGSKVGAYKPVASGATVLAESDAYRLWVASGQRGTLEQVNPQSFAAPVAPPVSAELEGKVVDSKQMLDAALEWKQRCHLLVVEGAGGLMSPLSWSMTNADFARALQLPIVIVTQNRLGVVNQALTTLVAARSMGLKVRCIVLNDNDDERRQHDKSTETNHRLLRSFLDLLVDPPMLTRLGFSGQEFEPTMDWSSLASDFHPIDGT